MLSSVRSHSIALLLVVSTVAPTVPAAVIPADSVKVMRFSSGDGFAIPGPGAFVIKEGRDLKVEFVPPAGNRPEQYREVDLQPGDLILIANGKRVKTIRELENAHTGTAIGAEFKLGIQRGKQMMIVTFRKADPKDLPQMKMKIVTSGGEGTEVLPAVGVILAEKGKKVVIDKILPMETSAVHGRDVQQGDIITSLNGQAVLSTRDFVARYDALDVGTNVSWILDRKGKSVAVSFAKPKPVGRIMIRKDAQ